MADNSSQFQCDTPESWEIARGYAGLLGAIPASFSSALRGLIADNEREGKISSVTRYNAMRLIKGRNLKTPYYYALLTYKPSAAEDQEFLSDDYLLKAFRPIDVAAIFGLVYLYKKAKKLCDPDEWQYIIPSLIQGVEIGGHVGIAISKVGMPGGLFAWALRHVALVSFVRHNRKHFQEYRRNLKNAGTIFDLNAQMHAWGCTDLQISSILLQSLGFGVDYSNSYRSGMAQEIDPDRTEVSTSPFKVADIWIKSLLKDASVPNIIHDSSYYPPEELVKTLKNRSKDFLEKGSKHSWLDKGKDDMSPRSTPQLFEGGVDAEEVVTAADEPGDQSEEELREVETQIA
ncbi:MAG: hypothetical protein J5J00_13470 [Deltaproteobacteria bacterium]|nr:hypothetical protein [Deltaproteobacteria bacterium]